VIKAMEIELVGVNNGKYNVFVIKDDEYIGPLIARGYEWDGWMRTDVQKHYKPDTDILDIGANIGYNTLMFSDYGPVHSFEPVYNQIVIKNHGTIIILSRTGIKRVRDYGFDTPKDGFFGTCLKNLCWTTYTIHYCI